MNREFLILLSILVMAIFVSGAVFLFIQIQFF